MSPTAKKVVVAMLIFWLAISAVNHFTGENEQEVQDSSQSTNDTEKQGKVSYEIIDQYIIVGTSSIGQNWMKAFVVVENTGDNNLYLGSSTLDVEDSSGRLVKSLSHVSAYPDMISPGETACYYEEFSFESELKESGYKLVPTLDVRKAKNSIVRLAVSDISIQDNDYKGVTVMGRIQNTSNKPQSLCYIVVFLKDSNNKVIDIFYTIKTDDLATGQIVGFEASNIISYDRVGLDEIERYQVMVYPLQFQVN